MNNSILKPIVLEKNGGLGNALRIAVNNCKNDLIARMDSDDISMNRRFEYQLEWMINHPSTEIVGGNITEFIGDENNIISRRVVPTKKEDIYSCMKSRCPFNHMTVMFKKMSVLAAGGYKDWFWNEDYFLWIRMMLNGAEMANIPLDLVNVRVGKDMIARRGGLKYFKSEKLLQKFMLDNKIIGLPRFLYNNAIRFVGEVLSPKWLRSYLFKFTRDTQVRPTVNNQEVLQEYNKDSKRLFPPFSVAMSVYKNDNPKWFDIALESIFNQTVVPDEVVLVVDGPVSQDIIDVISKYSNIAKNN